MEFDLSIIDVPQRGRCTLISTFNQKDCGRWCARLSQSEDHRASGKLSGNPVRGARGERGQTPRITAMRAMQILGGVLDCFNPQDWCPKESCNYGIWVRIVLGGAMHKPTEYLTRRLLTLSGRELPRL